MWSPLLVWLLSVYLVGFTCILIIWFELLVKLFRRCLVADFGCLLFCYTGWLTFGCLDFSLFCDVIWFFIAGLFFRVCV